MMGLNFHSDDITWEMRYGELIKIMKFLANCAAIYDSQYNERLYQNFTEAQIKIAKSMDSELHNLFKENEVVRINFRHFLNEKPYLCENFGTAIYEVSFDDYVTLVTILSPLSQGNKVVLSL